MTEEQKKRAKDFVSNNRNKKCINCGTISGFRVAPFLYHLPTEELYKGREIDFPLIIATCQGCKFVHQFSAIAAGIAEDPLN